jgi:hypothetical protein
MYRKDLLKEWSSGHLASYGWYLNYLVDSTPESEHRLREKFKDTCFDKPTSIDCSFRGDKRSHSAKKLKKTKDQLIGPSSDKPNEEDLKQKEPPPNP